MLNKPLLFFSIIAILAAAVCSAQEETTPPEPEASALLSSIHMWKGEQLLKSGNTEEATEHFLMASRYTRNSPDPHFALAGVYLPNSFMDAFLEFATGIKLLLSDFVYQSLLVSNLVVILLIAAGITIYTASAVVICRHARTVWYSILITLSAWVRGWYLKAIVIGCVLSFFVILSGRSPIGVATWTLVLGLALCWRFARSPERRVLAGLVVFLCIFGFLLNAATRVLSTQRFDSPVKLAAMVDRIDERMLIGSIDNDNNSSRFDPINEFMLGLLALKKGSYDSAIERFNLASKYAPRDPAILNNLGVAFHGLERYEEAVASFRQALRYGPREALIHYNYAQTLNALLQYDLSQEELAKASTLDFDLTRLLVTQKETSSLVPMNLQTRILWKLALEEESRTTRFAYHPVESGTGGVVVLVLLSGALLAMMRRAKVPAGCDICGKTLESQISRRRRKEFLCRECHRIKESGASSEAVEEHLENRLRKRATYEAIKRIVLGLVVPGSAYYLAGRRSKGLALAFVIYALLILAASGGIMVEPIPNMGPHPLSGWSLPLFVIVYALYGWRSTVLAVKSAQETRG